jgi:hypothetical protein
MHIFRIALLIIVIYPLGVSAMDVRNIDATESQGLEAERQWVQDLIKGFGSDVVLSKTKDDLPTLQTIIENGPYTESPENELVVIGTTFGDILTTELGLHWVVVTDEYGTDIGLQYKNLEIYLFPRDMIVKRFEQGEEIDLTFMFGELVKVVNEKANDSSISSK